jgi:hypothetical protein
MLNILSFAIVQGAAVACLIMQRRIAKLDENGTSAKGTYKCTFSIPATCFFLSGSAARATRVTIWIHNEKNCWIRIIIKPMRIRNHAFDKEFGYLIQNIATKPSV